MRNEQSTDKRAEAVRPSATVEQVMALPPWLAAMRSAMAEAVTPEDLKAVIVTQVRKAKEGDTKAAKFVTDQAHQLLQAEQRRPITITQTNHYHGGVQLDAPAAAEPADPRSLELAAGRVAAGLPPRLPGDRREREDLRADDDEAEKEVRRRQEADAALAESEPWRTAQVAGRRKA